MTDHRKMLVSAQVILYSDDRINENDAQECEKYFREAGFELGHRLADSFAITASVETFEQVFDCRIVIDDYGTHIDAGTDSTDYALPLGPLSDYLRHCLHAVTFTAPPDFGPTNF